MCTDASLTYLNKFGFNVVRLPRENISPLTLLGKNGGQLSRLGPLSGIVIPGPKAVEPPVITDKVAANVNGQRTDKLDVNIGVKILERLLEAMGAGGLDLSLSFSKAARIEFLYQNVLTDYSDATAVASYLQNSTPNIASPLLDYVDDSKHSFVITETLKSDSFSISATDSSGASAQVNLPSIQQAIGINGNVNASSNSQSSVSFQGKQKLVFGFKAFPCWIQVHNGSAAFRLAPPHDGTPGPLSLTIPGLTDPHTPTPVIFGERKLLTIH
jgi:hypothetical protein